MTDLLRRNNSSVTVHSKRSKIPTVNRQCQFATRV